MTNQQFTSPTNNLPPGQGRREFLCTLGMLGFGSAVGLAAADAQTNPAQSNSQGAATGPGEVPRRRLGRNGLEVSALGVGGHHLGDFENPDEAIQLIHEALDAGINFFDNCWEYYNGETENLLGRGLKGHRDRAFVMTKVCTHGRGADEAMRMLEQSLRRLQTDHLDLWQIHAISYDNDPDLAYAKGGVIEALDTAKQQGKTRLVGFTGHKDPAFHLRMLELVIPSTRCKCRSIRSTPITTVSKNKCCPKPNAAASLFSA